MKLEINGLLKSEGLHCSVGQNKYVDWKRQSNFIKLSKWCLKLLKTWTWKVGTEKSNEELEYKENRESALKS